MGALSAQAHGPGRPTRRPPHEERGGGSGRPPRRPGDRRSRPRPRRRRGSAPPPQQAGDLASVFRIDHHYRPPRAGIHPSRRAGSGLPSSLVPKTIPARPDRPAPRKVRHCCPRPGARRNPPPAPGKAPRSRGRTLRRSVPISRPTGRSWRPSRRDAARRERAQCGFLLPTAASRHLGARPAPPSARTPPRPDARPRPSNAARATRRARR